MYSSEANLLPANDSVAIKDIYNNNDEIADNNDENLIPDRKNIHDNDIFKKSIQNQIKEKVREKKEKLYEFKNSDNKTIEPIATNNNGETQGNTQMAQQSL